VAVFPAGCCVGLTTDWLDGVTADAVAMYPTIAADDANVANPATRRARWAGCGRLRFSGGRCGRGARLIWGSRGGPQTGWSADGVIGGVVGSMPGIVVRKPQNTL
jgi:hypothetical protein